MTILETERLYLRPMTPMDADEAFELNNDPDVIMYTGDKPFDSIAEAAKFLENYKDYEKYGVGRWAAIRKSDSAWLGWCGLKFSPDTGEIDLGFRLHCKFWNHGYATEASIASINYGFSRFNFPYITGMVMKKNIRSVNVLEKAGLRYWKDAGFHDAPGSYYRIDNPSHGRHSAIDF